MKKKWYETERMKKINEYMIYVAICGTFGVIAFLSPAETIDTIGLLNFHWIWNLLIIIGIAEFFFWTSDSRPDSYDCKFTYTIQVKIVSFLVASGFWLIINAFVEIVDYLAGLEKLPEYTAIEIIILIGLYGYIKLNETKYKRRKK